MADLGPASNRTKVGNGRRVIAGVDGRTHGGRRFKELYRALVAATGQANAGQTDQADAPPDISITPTQDSLIRRIVAFQMNCETTEAAQARGEVIDISSYTLVTEQLRRLTAELRATSNHRPSAEDPTPPPPPGSRLLTIMGEADG